MGKKVAVAQMNGYFLLVLADVIVPQGATECQKSWWVQANVVGIISPPPDYNRVNQSTTE